MRETRTIPTDLLAARELAEDILSHVEARGGGEEVRFAIRLALEEALSNAVKHGNRFDPEKKITVSTCLGADRADITVADEGEGFDPGGVPDPTVDENLEKPCGRGIMLMRAYMDEVEYNDRGTEVHMVKRISRGPT
jgi:serine/threonine-protein kinase RsbW